MLAPLFSGFVVAVIFCLWEWKGARLPIVPSRPILTYGPSSRLINSVGSVYIFKHVTVTGVYITMFIKSVSPMCHCYDLLNIHTADLYSSRHYIIFHSSSKLSSVIRRFTPEYFLFLSL